MNANLLLAYYGDDFTGSTDVMEALSRAGLRTVLFLQPPTPTQLAEFPGLRAFGLAGGSRMLSPEEMERELPLPFEALKASGAPIIHYKMCSTFDSSPRIGSIGRAIEIGRRVFGERPTSLMVGAPVLGRYVVFGNLFARSGLDTDPFRLDRHPTMSAHPVTPMSEADLRLILAEQTHLPVELVDVLKLDDPCGRKSEAQGVSAPIVLFDTLRDAHLPVIGREIARLAEQGPLFVVGSSGIEYALVAHWREVSSPEMGKAQRDVTHPPSVSSQASRSNETRPSPAKPVDRIISISGSCSPVTDRQIARAAAHGFREIPVPAKQLIQDGSADAVRAALLLEVERALPGSNGVILHTSRGPEDSRIMRDKKTLAAVSARLGPAMAAVLEDILGAMHACRAVVCGGDTSMQVARALGIVALEYLCPIAPGCPLCRVHAPGRVAHGREIAFKGGQVGRDSFFLDALNAGLGKP